MVEARFQCYVSSTSQIDEDGKTVQRMVSLNAIYGNGTGNESWSKATPAGSINMWINNPDAFNGFKQGKTYKVTFEEI